MSYYKVNIYCHSYFRDGVVEEDAELYSTFNELEKDINDYVKTEYGKKFYQNATEYGKLTFEVISTNDSDYYKSKVKEVSYKELLRYFGINQECNSLEELYDILSTHNDTGEYVGEDQEDSISNNYWDFLESELEDGTIEWSNEVDYVKIGNRIFEIPKQD